MPTSLINGIKSFIHRAQKYVALYIYSIMFGFACLIIFLFQPEQEFDEIISHNIDSDDQQDDDQRDDDQQDDDQQDNDQQDDDQQDEKLEILSDL